MSRGRSRAGDSPSASAMTEILLAEAALLAISPPPPDLAETLGSLLALLYRWNRVVNLTALREPAEGARRHALEALEALEIIDDREGDVLADLGSGNGFPGLAILLARPHWRGLLVESTQRKADFLRAAIATCGVSSRVEVLQAHLTNVSDLPAQTTIVTMRGFPDPRTWMIEAARRAGVRCTAGWLSSEDASAIEATAHEEGLETRRKALRTRALADVLVVGTGNLGASR